MVPRVSNPGRSFEGASLYYLHDKEAATSNRVEFTQVDNVPTQDPEAAMRWMAYSTMAANEAKQRDRIPGRRIEKSVWTVSLSWHPEEQPERDHMIEAGRSWLSMRGLQDHQTVMVAHNDEQHPHLHMIINLVHPQTLRLNKEAVSHARLHSSKWAEEYEREHGKIYCEQRVVNNERRRKGEYVNYQEPQLEFKEHIAKLYQASDSGEAFLAALQHEGYALVQGKRILVVDRDGKAHSLSRQLEDVRAKDIRAKLEGVQLPTLPDERGKQEGEKAPVAKREKLEYFDRDEQLRQQDDRIIDAAIRNQKEEVRTGLINRTQDQHFDEWGTFREQNVRAGHQLDEKIDTHYGEHERQLRKTIASLETTLGKSAIEKGLMRLTGQLSRTAKDDLLAARKSLASIEERKTEMRDALDHDIELRRAVIEDRHGKERKAAHRNLDPRTLDPIARSIEAQQRGIDGPNPGAAQPTASKDTDRRSGYSERRAAFFEAANDDRAPSQNREGPSLSKK